MPQTTLTGVCAPLDHTLLVLHSHRSYEILNICGNEGHWSRRRRPALPCLMPRCKGRRHQTDGADARVLIEMREDAIESIECQQAFVTYGYKLPSARRANGLTVHRASYKRVKS